MRDLTDRAIETALHRGASYVDARVVRRREESVNIKTGRVEGVAASESQGIGIRAIVDGAWGFASTTRLEPAAVDATAAEAVRIARASATALRRPGVPDDRPPAPGADRPPVAQDPLSGLPRAQDKNGLARLSIGISLVSIRLFPPIPLSSLMKTLNF